MIRTESCTGHGCNTHRLHQKGIKMIILFLDLDEILEGESDDPDPENKGSC